jgi:arsenate reductase
MITIYHNNRCAKSRSALEIIKRSNADIHVVEYLKDPPTEKDLQGILKKLGMKAEEIIRKKEELFRTKFAGKKYSEEEWISILSENPVLIERPIVIKGNKAVIGRPPENVMKLL